MKKVIILTLLVAIIIAVAIYIILLPPPPPPPPPPPSLMPSEKYSTIESSGESKQHPVQSETHVLYFTDLDDEEFMNEVNSKISNSIKQYSDEILLFVGGISYNDQEDEIIRAKQYIFNANSERYNNGNYISLVVIMDYDTGGLRTNRWKDTYNVDVVNNKLCKLSDIISFSGYEEAIVSEINSQAKNKNIPLMNGEYLSELPESQKFYIKDKKLYIYFEQGAIAAFDAGEMEFEMPYIFNETTNKFDR